MPTKNFFSDSGLGPENMPMDKASSLGGKPTESDPFAGMQPLDFDFDLKDPEESGASGAASLDALFDEPPRSAPAARPQQTSAPQAAPFVFDEPAPQPARPAQRAASARRGAAFDLSALEKEIDRPAQKPQMEEFEGYAPLALDGFDLVREQPAAQTPAPTPNKPQAPTPAPKAAPFALGDLSAAPAQPAAQTPAPTPGKPQTPSPAPKAAPFALGDLSAAPAQPAAQTPAPTPSKPQTPSPAPKAAPFALGDLSAAPAQPAAQTPAPTPSKPQTPSPAPKAAPFVFDDAPAAPAQTAAPQQAAPTPSKPQTAAPAPKAAPGPGQNPAPRPASRPADYSTISFSLGDVSVEAPTMAFMPIEQINSAASAQAAANRRAAEKNAPPAQPAPSPESRAARMAKERDIGAAVFSALMEQDDAPAAPPRAASAGTPRVSAATMEWPSPVRSESASSRAPKPINWRASDTAQRPQAERPAQQPAAPSAPAQQPAPAAQDDALTPLDFDFNFDGTDTFDSPEASAPRETTRGLDLIDLYDRDPEERPARPRKAPRSDGGRRASGKGGSSGTGGKGGAPAKSIFAWCGILLIAVLIILYFVLFGDKDGDSSSPGSDSNSTASSLPAQSVSVPPEPVAPSIPRDEWYMVLANRDSVLSMDFTVAETATVGEALVDARIADALRQMVSDAAAAGIRLKPTNGYRTVTRQDELWKARVQKLITENGLSQADAEVRALDYTSRAGTSDHNTGLGLDIVSEDHPAKDAAYADTPAAAWLLEHAAEYGFILRYPSDKTAQTGMDFEPWHYRYVGVEQAQLIKASGLCLEEYLAQ